MAVPAPIFPPEPGELDLPPEVRERLRASWAAWWEPLKAELRTRPRELDSADERLALARFVRGLIALTETYGAALEPSLRQGFARAFEELVAEEEKQTPTIRRLGLKHVGRAIEVLGELYETARAFAPQLPLEGIGRLLPDADEELAAGLGASMVALLRLELYAFLAFDLVREDPLEEFVEWARKAHMEAERAVPYVTMLAAQSRAPWGELSASLVLTEPAFERVVHLMENPPAPSDRLRQLMRRGTA